MANASELFPSSAPIYLDFEGDFFLIWSPTENETAKLVECGRVLQRGKLLAVAQGQNVEKQEPRGYPGHGWRG